MITTVTLNASVDKACLVDAIRLGQPHRMKECHVTAGGKGLNVARVARRLGQEATATGYVGGFAGMMVESLLHADGIGCHFVPVAGESRTCVNIIDESTGLATEFREPGVQVSPEDHDRLLSIYAGLLPGSQMVCLSGGAPQGVRADFYNDMIRLARAAGKPVILDTSGPFLANGIVAGPTLVKPNDDEMAALLGTPITGVDEALCGARQLCRQGAGVVVVSLGAQGALWVDPEQAYWGVPPRLPALNTVGCGDSLVAGLAVGLCRGDNVADTLRLGVAVSAANTLTVANGSFEDADLAAILPQVTVNRLEG